jgi:Protein kinase domain
MPSHPLHRLVSRQRLNRVILSASRLGESPSLSWLRVVAILGGTAATILVLTESAANHDEARQKSSEDGGLDQKASTAASLPTKQPPSKSPPFIISTPRSAFPIQQNLHTVYSEAQQGKYTLFGRGTKKKRSHTIALYASEVSQQTVRSMYKVDWKRPLGQGGFGAVYSATDRKTGEKVALKQISKKYTNDVGFQREMEAFLHLRRAGGHPNICGLRENFDEGNYFYFSLDLISGGEMFDHLIRLGPYSEEDAARLVREVASALGFMHGIGFVHG